MLHPYYVTSIRFVFVRLRSSGPQTQLFKGLGIQKWRMSSSSSNSLDKDIIPDLVDEFYPPNQPLSPKYKKGFGYKTIRERVPAILTKVIDGVARDENEIAEKLGEEARAEVKEVIDSLSELKDEMVKNKPIRRMRSPVWNEYLGKIAKRDFGGVEENVRWFSGPWLFVECYMYGRMNEAFKGTTRLKNYDPFRKQKEEAFFESLEPACALGAFIEKSGKSCELLQILLEVSLWGNRCDLSISQGEANSQSGNLVDQLGGLREKILVDDSVRVWEVLEKIKKTSSAKERRIGYICDNSAFELFADLCLADALLESGLLDNVDFYVKDQPWFVSDVLVADFHWLLDTMASMGDKPVLVRLAAKWKNNVKTGKFTLVEREFWTYPHAFSEMKESDEALYKELESKSFLIFKGDLNYRKLISDINWDYDTPFVKALLGFTPAPLLALRTLKADCVAGLPSGVGEKLSEISHDWMNTGEYGLIQLAQ